MKTLFRLGFTLMTICFYCSMTIAQGNILDLNLGESQQITDDHAVMMMDIVAPQSTLIYDVYDDSMNSKLTTITVTISEQNGRLTVTIDDSSDSPTQSYNESSQSGPAGTFSFGTGQGNGDMSSKVLLSVQEYVKMMYKQ